MFVRRSLNVGFFVVCFMFIVASQLLAQEGMGNQMAPTAPAVENKMEAAPAAPEIAAVTNEVQAAPQMQMPEAAPTAAVNEEKPAAEKKTEWVWGEVVSVDPVAKQALIKHLDYETYEEVQMTLKINEKTLFENVTDLTGVKAGDHITVDYSVVDGVNVADLIVIDKGDLATDTSSSKEKTADVSSSVPAVSVPQNATNMMQVAEVQKPSVPEAAANVMANMTEKSAQ